MTLLVRSLRAICSSQPLSMFSSVRSCHYSFLSSNQFSAFPSPRSSLCHQGGSLTRWNFQAHSSSNETQARPSFLPWGLAGLCLGAYLFEKEKSWISSAYCESENKPHLVFALREDNEKLTLEKLKQMGIYLEIDPKAVTKDQASWYKVKHPDFEKSPFRVRLEGGQLLWQSFDLVNGENDDITPIARLYETSFQPRRTLLVNTGLHGNAEGEIAYAIDGTDFVTGDMDIFLPGNFATVHIVAPKRPPYTHKEDQAKDILDAWCYSAKTERDKNKDFLQSKRFAEELAEDFKSGRRCRGRYLRSFEDILASFGLLGYKAEAKKDENIEYVPLKSCSKEVQKQLQNSSRCYILGHGGRGKSRLSLEIQESAQEKKEVYIDTVRIALRSLGDPMADDWTKFMKYVRNILVEDKASSAVEKKARELISLNEEEALKVYFSKLGAAAEKAKKKCLVIVDNVDDLEQDQKLSLILSAIESYQPREGQTSPFQLLVTSRELFNKGAFGSDQIVDIATYWVKDSLWSLFSENFLKDCKHGSKESARKYIELKSDALHEQFKKFENITAFIVTIAKLLAKAYDSSGPARADEVLETLTSRIHAVLKGRAASSLGDYRLGYLLPTLLEVLSKKHQESNISAEDAHCIFELLALISNGKIPEDVLRAAFLQFTNPQTKNAEIDADMHFDEILKAMEKSALIIKEGKPDEKTISMSSNYNFLMRGMLIVEYGGENEKRRQKIHEQIMAAATVLHKRLETTDRDQQEKVRKYLKLLLSLTSYSSIELRNSVSNFVLEKHKAESIQENARKFLAPIQEKTQELVLSRLVAIPFCELRQDYRSFFSNIPHLEGYSINPQLVLSDTRPSNVEINKLIKKLEEAKGAEKSKIARELNNCFVNAKDSSLTFDEKAVRDALRKAKGSENFDHVTGGVIDKNLRQRNYTQWYVFPEIRLLETSPQELSRASNWWQDNQDSLLKEGTANFSGQKFGKNFSLLTLHLLKQESIILKKVDLSNNDLGKEKDGEPSVCMLLQFARYLETLDFSHNYLYKLSAENLETILSTLEHRQSVKTLILHHNSLRDAEIADLCTKLEKLKKLEKIYLHANSFGKEGLEKLENLMKRNTSIKFITTALPSEESRFPYAISNWMTQGYSRLGHDTTKTLRRAQNGKVYRDKENREPGVIKSGT